MAVVYLARDLKHDRDVAIKVLKPEIAHALGPDRFLREIRFTAQLSHPHILPLLDSGEADGHLYYVMPYVTGESLRERLDPGRQTAPVRDALGCSARSSTASPTRTGHGVVHRDIKPDNVMLAERHALLMDFGVAKALTDATAHADLTSAGISLGTPTYMAPEQAAADPHIDHRVDIYAVGVLAYEMLTGAPPFKGTPQAVIGAHISTPPAPLGAGIPPGDRGHRDEVPRQASRPAISDRRRAAAGHRVAGDTPAAPWSAMGSGPPRAAGACWSARSARSPSACWVSSAPGRWSARAGSTRQRFPRCDG